MILAHDVDFFLHRLKARDIITITALFEKDVYVMRKILTLFVTFAIIMCSLPVITISATTDQFAGGSGTESDPYLIATKEHLNNVRYSLTAYYKMVAYIEFTDADFAEGGTFYNEGEGWEPIGCWEDPFTGVFDGNNFSITNLDCEATNQECGIFGCNYGEIVNMTIANSSINCKYAFNNSYVGAIVGTNYGKINNCANENSFINASGEIGIVGGLVGENCGEILHCINTGNVYGYVAGGIVGSQQPSSCIECVNYGEVSGVEASGGIAGYNCGTISSSRNEGAISSNRNEVSNTDDIFWTRSLAGGISGRSEGDAVVSKCSNYGVISSTGTNCMVNAGGIIGWNRYVTINECYNMATIKSSQYAGGIVGASEHHTSTSLENCFNAGRIEAECTGGIVGYLSNGTVLNTYNIGETIATDIAGGVLGCSDGGTLENCYYIDSNENAVGVGDAAKSIKCNDEELQNPETFVGFDFNAIWTMAGDPEYPYPELQVFCKSVDGDVNFDGILDTTDAREVLRYIVGVEVFTDEQIEIADYNQDGKITTADAREILRAVLTQ